jgi:hypothetical protein
VNGLVEVEVWSLMVQSPDSKQPAVSVHANEDECEARFREEYDPEDEGLDMSFGELAEHLNITFAIDIHVVTTQPKKEIS